MKKLFLLISIILISISCFSQAKKDTSNYYLIGKIEDFKLAYAAIMQPDDVTANQKKAIAKWFESIQIIIPNVKPDSTKQNPKK